MFIGKGRKGKNYRKADEALTIQTTLRSYREAEP